MEGSTLKGSPASMKNGPLEISEDALKTAKERIFRLKKNARKENNQTKSTGEALDDVIVKKKVSRRPVVYIGHLPHGFYEEELRSFFTQFGQVCRVKVSRSKKTGNSKGYAFIEFGDDDVARIASETMNNYLMFERLIKTKYIPAQRVHPKMFPSRWITPESYPTLERRKKILKKQEEMPTDDEVKKHRAKVIKSITRSLAVLNELGVDDYLPLVYDPPRDAAIVNEEGNKVEVGDSTASEEKTIQDEAKEETVKAASTNDSEAKASEVSNQVRVPVVGTPVKRKAEKPLAKTPAKANEASESVKSTPAKVSKPTPAKTPAKVTNEITSENANATPSKNAKAFVAVKTPAKTTEVAESVKSTPAKVSKPILAKTPDKTPAKVSNEAIPENAKATPSKTAKASAAAKTPAKTTEVSESVKPTPAKVSKPTPAKTPAKASNSVSAENAKSTPSKITAPSAVAKTPAKLAEEDAVECEPIKGTPTQPSTAAPVKTPGRAAKSVPAEPLKSTPAKTPGKATPAKTPAKPADAATVKPTPVKTPAMSTVGASNKSTPAKTPNASMKSPHSKTVVGTPNQAKTNKKSTPAKTPKSAETVTQPSKPTPGKTQSTPARTPAKVAEKMEVDDIPRDTTEKSALSTPAKTPVKFATPKSLSKDVGGRTPSKQTPKASGSASGTPIGKAMADTADKEKDQQATPKISPRKRQAESDDNVSPAKIAAVRTPVSILKSPAGTVIVTPMSAERSDVVSTALTPPARRLTRAAAKRMSLKISPNMDVFSPRMTRKATGTPSTPAGRRKSVRL